LDWLELYRMDEGRATRSGGRQGTEPVAQPTRLATIPASMRRSILAYLSHWRSPFMPRRTSFCLVALSGLLAALGLMPASSELWGGEKQPKTITNSIGMKLVLIPKGKFTMGSTKAERDEFLRSVKDEDDRKKLEVQGRAEGPRHEVEITKPFRLGVHEVTQ